MADNPAPPSAIAAAREAYVDRFEVMLELYDQLDSKLTDLETQSTAAGKKLDELYNTLEAHLNRTRIASRASSLVSVIGIILSLTPAAPVGIPLAIAGGASGIAMSATEHFKFEKDAAEGFKEVMKNYATAFEALEKHFQDIQDNESNLHESLTSFLTLLATTPTPPRVKPEVPSGPGIRPPRVPYAANGFSKMAFHGLVVGAAGVKPLATLALKGGAEFGKLLGKGGGLLLKASPVFKVLGKVLPVVGKVLPGVSIFVEGYSIFETWKVNNETLEQDKKLKDDISGHAMSVREAVRKYKSSLEEQLGNQQLRKTLRKLLRLRRPPPGPPPGADKLACAMLAAMDQFKGLGFWVFGLLMGEEHEDPTQNDYTTDLVGVPDVEQLGQKALCAPVVDSVFVRYSEIVPPTDKEGAGDDQKPLQSTLGAFRANCDWVDIGDTYVFNVSGTQKDKRAGSWIKYWKSWLYDCVRGGCVPQLCKILEPGSHSWLKPLLGGHLQLAADGASPRHWYILPICPAHNAPSGTYDRKWGGGGTPMLTKQTAWAVKIPAMRF